MIRIIAFCFSIVSLISCQPDIVRQDPIAARQLHAEGMEILENRISIQDTDEGIAMELNKKAIEKFSAAYKMDTSFTKAVLFASECTMYGKDYKSCIYFTSKLKEIDNSKRNQDFCEGRIAYCEKQLQAEEEK
ncbi:MAG: hypothetical protein H7Y42_07865 [Chitinophagaceae bacterium]|nr:hypothetical protein [Chitinophagaceae bacterium]